MSRALCSVLLALAAGVAHAEGDGRRVYETRCYFCHGYAGDARTAAAAVLQPPPRDFTALAPGELPGGRMLAAVRDGRPGTAMQGFSSLLDEAEMRAVVAYVERRFVGGGSVQARYHSRANGWSGEPGDSAAAPWVLGARSLAEPWEALEAEARVGRRLFLSACVSCHLPAERDATGRPWRGLAVSYPPGNYVEQEHEAGAEAPGEPTAVFERHEAVPPLAAADPEAERGRALYERACADCHAGNGSGRNWVGSFIDPPPPDLRDPASASVRSRAELLAVLREGVPGSAMPAFGGVLDEAELSSLASYFDAALRPLAK